MKNIQLQQHNQLARPVQKMASYQLQTKALPICDILYEINGLNDKTLLSLIGSLNFNRINIQYYNVDILDVVADNNMLTFHSDGGFYGDDAIEIKLSVMQQSGAIENTILRGNFIYTINDDKSKRLSNNFLKIINNTNYGIKTWGRSARL